MTPLASTTDVVRLSIEVAFWATIVSAPFAIAFGWVLARTRFRGKSIVTTIVYAPLVLPPVVTGFLLLKFFGRRGPVGSWLAEHGVSIPHSFAGAVVAAVVVGFPLFVVVARGAFEAVDRRHDEIARTLGTPPWRAFVRVTLPLALPGIFAGAVLSFARALGEFGATTMLVSNLEGETRTISMAVYALFDAPNGEDGIWPLVGVSIGLSFVAILAYEWLVARHRRLLELDRGH